MGRLERHKPSTMDNIREEADISTADISQLVNSHQNNLDRWVELQVRGRICIVDFGCPFKAIIEMESVVSTYIMITLYIQSLVPFL